MNKVFKTIWNDALGAWVVVSEITKSHRAGGSSSKGSIVSGKQPGLMLRGASALLGLLMASFLATSFVVGTPAPAAAITLTGGQDIYTNGLSASQPTLTLGGNVTWNTGYTVNSAGMSTINIDGAGNTITMSNSSGQRLITLNQNNTTFNLINATVTQPSGSHNGPQYGLINIGLGNATAKLNLSGTTFSSIGGTDFNTYASADYGPIINMRAATGGVMNIDGGTAGVTFVGNHGLADQPGVVGIYSNNTMNFTGKITFDSNWTANYGGAVSLYEINGSQINFNGTTYFINNHACAFGGAIDMWGGADTLTFNGPSEFTGNYVYNSSAFTFNYPNHITNQNTRGGALNMGYLAPQNSGQANAVFNNSVKFTGNFAIDDTGATFSALGGAVSVYSNNNNYNYNITFNSAAIFDSNYVFSNNGGKSYGGAIYYDSPTATITLGPGSKFINNYAQTLGGAIYIAQGVVNLNATGVAAVAGDNDILFQGNRQNASFHAITAPLWAPDASGGGLSLANAMYIGGANGFLNLTADANNFIRFYDPIASAGAITVNKTGAGEAIFYGDGTGSAQYDSPITGNTTVNGGTFTLANKVTYGATASGNFTVNSGGTVQGGANSTLKGYGIYIKPGGTLAANGGNFSLSAGTGGITSTGGNFSGWGTILAQNISLDVSGNISTANIAAAGTPSGSDGLLMMNAFLIGGGGLNKIGNGTFGLKRVNTYSGPTTITAGTLQAFAADTIKASSSLTVNGGTFDLNNLDETVNNFSGNGVGAAVTTGDGGNTFTVINSTTPLTYAGTISGAGNFTKQGTGYLSLTGNVNLTDTMFSTITVNNGGLTITGGNTANAGVALVNGNAIMTVSGNSNLNLNNVMQVGGTLAAAGTGTGTGTGNGTLTVDSQATGTFGKLTIGDSLNDGIVNITSLGTVNTGSGTVTISNKTNAAGTGLNINGGILKTSAINAINGVASANNGTIVATASSNQFINGFTGVNTFTLAAGGLKIDSNGFDIATSNVLGGTGGLTKQGSGTFTSSALNTYTGDTNVSAGTLRFTGAGNVASANVGIAAGATLFIDAPSSSDYAFSKNLSGAGVLKVNLAAPTGVFTYTPLGGSSFTGTVDLMNSTFTLNTTTLSLATLQLDAGNTTTVAAGAQMVGNLNINGGKLVFVNLPTGIIGTGNLNLGSGSVAIDPLAITGSNTSNLLAQDEGSRFDLIKASGTVTGSASNLAMTDASGNPVGPQYSNIIQSGATVAVGTYGFTLANDSKGLFTNYTLTQLDLQAGKTLTLTGASTTPAGADELHALVTGSGNLTINATATNPITLNNTLNSYSGATTVSGGTLIVGADKALGNTNNLIINSGTTLDLNAKSQTVGALNGAGTMSVNGGSLTVANGGNFSGVIKDSSGAVIIQGTTPLILTGANIYTGATTVDSGATMQIGNNGTTGSYAGNIVDNGTLSFYRSDALTHSAAITGTGNVAKNGVGTVTLNGTNNTYSGGTSINSGTLVATNGGAVGTGTIANGSALQLDFATDSTLANVILNGGSLNKTGAAVAKLTAAGSSQGLVNVTAGTLELAQLGQFKSTSNYTTLTNATTKLDAGSTLNVTNIFAQNANSTLDITTNGTGPNVTAGTAVLSGALVLKGVTAGAAPTTSSAANGSQYTLIHTTNGISGNFTSTDILAGTLDYLVYGGGVSADLKDYNIGYRMAWTDGGKTKGTGNFTLTNAGDTFTVDTVLADQTIPSGGFTLPWNGKDLSKLGAGTLTLSAANTYSGATTVSDGTLALSGTGTIASSSNVALTAATSKLDISAATVAETVNNLSGVANSTVALGTNTLTVNETANTAFNGVISGAGGLTKNGTAILTLGGAETYSGATTISDGTLALSGTGTIASSSNVALTAATSKLDISAATVAETVNNLSGVANSTVALGTNTLTVNETGATTFNGVISGAGGLTKAGAAALTLTAAEAYSGATNVNAGTLALSGAGSIASSSNVALANSGSSLDVSGVTTSTTVNNLSGVTGSQVVLGGKNLVINDTVNTTVAGVISGAGGSITKTGSADLTLSAANTYTGGTTINTGSVTLVNAAGAGTGTVTNNSILNLDLAASGTVANVLAGTGTLNKNGITTAKLTGAGSTEGVVNVNAGTLELGQAGNFNATGYTTAANATTKLDSGSTLAVTKVFTQSGNSTLDITTNGTGPNVTAGTASLSGALTLSNLNGGAAPVKSSDAVAANQYTLIHTTGGISGDFTSNNIGATTPDYLLYGGGVTADGFDYKIGYKMAWTDGGKALGTGNFTLTNASDTFLVDTVLADQSVPVGGFTKIWNGKDLVKAGAGTLTLSAANTYDGSTTINNGMLALSGAGTIASSSNVALTAATSKFDISATTSGATVKDLSGVSGSQINLAGKTLTVNEANNTIYAGNFDASAGSLTKAGSATLILTGNTAWTGDTNINSGVLTLDGSNGGAKLVSNVIGQDGTTLNLNKGATLKGIVDPLTLNIDSLSSWTATGNSTLAALSNSGVVDLGSSLLTVNAVFTQTGTGTLKLNVISGTPNTPNITASSAAIAGALVVTGFNASTPISSSTVTQNQYTVIHTTGFASNGITGNFSPITPALSSGLDYLVESGHLANSNNDYVLGFQMAWTDGGQALGTGNFTLTNASDTFLVDTVLADNTQFSSSNLSNTGWNGKDLAKFGAGKLTLSAANTYDGLTTINAGTLALSGAGTIASSSNVALTGASSIFDINATTVAETVNNLSGVTGSQVVLGGKNLVINDTANTTVAGVISGAGGSITKTGSADLTLSAANTYTGGTTINTGSVTLVNAAGAGTGTVTNSSILNLDLASSGTVANVLAGAGTLNKNGITTAKLTGAGSTEGIVNVNAGTLELGQAGNFNATGYTTAANATTKLDSGSTLAVTNVFTQSGNSTLDITTNGTGPNVTAGTASLSGALTVNNLSSGTPPATSSAANGAQYTLIKTSGGITGDFTSNNISASTPDYLVYGGGLSADLKNYNIGYKMAWTDGGQAKGTGNFTLTNATDTFLVDTVLADQSVPAGGFTNSWNGKDLVKAGAGTLTLSAANTYDGSTSINAGTLALSGAGSIANSSSVSVAANSGLDVSGITSSTTVNNLGGAGTVALGAKNLVINETVNNSVNGVISGAGGSITKNGAADLTLSAANTYTGGTTINAGSITLTNAAGAGTGAITNGSVLNANFNNGALANIISGAGTTNVKGTNVAITGNNSGFSGTLDVLSGASATVTSASNIGNATAKAVVDGLLNVTPAAGNFAFVNQLTGAGTVATNMTNATDAFSFGAGTGNAFAGTLDMKTGTFNLSGNNTTALTNATLVADAGSKVIVGSGNQAIKGLTIGSGEVQFNANVPADMFANGMVNSTNLDLSGNGKVQVNIPNSLAAMPTAPNVNSTNLLSQDDGNAITKLASGTNITGNAGSLQLVDQNGNAVNQSSQNVSIGDATGTSEVAIGTYGYGLNTSAANDGLYVAYKLNQVDILAGKTLALTPAAGATGIATDLSAKVIGTGNLTAAAGLGNTVSLSNSNNSYSGVTTVDSGTLKLAANNALGNTSSLVVNGQATADINGKTQIVGAVTTAANSTVNLNGGNLTISNGGTTAANSLTGAGTMTLAGGNLAVSGANSGLTADVTINSAAAATLDNVAGLGNSGTISDNGIVNLTGATGNLAKAVNGTGAVNLQNGSDVTLTGTNALSGSWNTATGTTLTASTQANLGTAVVNNAGTFNINGVAAGSIANQLSGAGTLNKTGAGNTTLTNANSSQGVVDVKTGTLTFAQNGAAFNTTGDYTTETGATTDIGKNGSTLNIGGALTQAADSTLNVTLAAINNNPAIIKTDSANLSGKLNINGFVAADALNGAVMQQASTVGTNQYHVISSNSAIQGDFTSQTIAPAVTTADYLVADGHLTADKKGYDVGLELAWTAQNPVNRSGSFTMATGTGFNVDIALADMDVTGNSKWNGKDLTKAGAGKLELSKANSYTGSTTIDGGTLALTGAGNIATSSSVAVNNNSVLDTSGVTTSVSVANKTGGTFSNIGTTIKNLSGDATGMVKTGTTTLAVNSTAGTTYNGDFDSTGGLIKTGDKELVLTGKTLYAGDTYLDNGTLTISGTTLTSNIIGQDKTTLNIINGSTLRGWIDPTDVNIDSASNWYMTDNSTVNAMTNAGNIYFHNVPAGTAFDFSTEPVRSITADSWNGNNGTVHMYTLLGGDSSSTDKLIINNSYTGTTTLKITNAGGVGSQTLQGIKIVNAESATTTSGTFLLAGGSLRVGSYTYTLQKGSATGDAALANDWFLVSLADPLPKPVVPPNIIPEYSIYTSLYNQAIRYGEASIGTLHDRMGAIDEISNNKDNIAWGRFIGQGDRNNGSKNGVMAHDIKTQTDLGAVQVGTDLWVSATPTHARTSFGLFGTYGHSRNWSANPDTTTADSAGYNEMDAYSLGAYLTHLAGNGGYLDFVLQASRYNVNNSDAANKHLSYLHGTGLAASLEAGQRFDMTQNGTTVEPQAQLLFQNNQIDGSRFTTDNVITNVKFARSNDVLLRASVRLASSWDTGTKEAFTAWITPGVYYNTGNNPTATFTNNAEEVTAHNNLPGLRAGAVAGIDGQIFKNVQLNAKIGGDTSIDKRNMYSYSGQIGLKVSF